jgi:hypothetical protein
VRQYVGFNTLGGCAITSLPGVFLDSWETEISLEISGAWWRWYVESSGTNLGVPIRDDLQDTVNSKRPKTELGRDSKCL